MTYSSLTLVSSLIMLADYVFMYLQVDQMSVGDIEFKTVEFSGEVTVNVICRTDGKTTFSQQLLHVD